jgi:hypothetical protein
MNFKVGHNDIGYEPEREALVVADLQLARQVLYNEARRWFQPELEGEDSDLSMIELNRLLNQIANLSQPSKLCLRGRVFWIQ